MYWKMAEFASKYEISIGEVKITIIREMLEKRFGFKCNHKDQLRKSKHGRTYCSGCWRFFELRRRDSPKPGQHWEYYVPKKTFLELMEEEKQEHMGDLLPDLR